MSSYVPKVSEESAAPPEAIASGPISMVRPVSREAPQTLGTFLWRHRELAGMSVAEVSRITRIPMASLEAIESDRLDELPGEVFVRGFLRAYAQSVRLNPDDVLARYTSSRRGGQITPLPVQTALQVVHDGQGRRFGVAIAFVLLLILLSLALSIVLKPRGHDMPMDLSSGEARPARVAAGSALPRSETWLDADGTPVT